MPGMSGARGKQRNALRARALDPEAKLFETATRDLWQHTVVASDGTPVGWVIRQVVEPRSYMIRYLIVYSSAEERHLLIPSNTIVDISEETVHCSLSRSAVRQLPTFVAAVDRTYEEAVYRAAQRTPYWVEEDLATLSAGPPPDPLA